ncbi:hypothetical protein J4477_01440 [Candidatus Pacearchaeota archaeon]|nr:hypothetical protein [Candidatus Pacearchaeota archaeon]
MGCNDLERLHELTFISGMALDMLCSGIDSKRNGEIQDATRYFAIAWAYNSFQEYDLGMRMCNKLLFISGIEDDDIELYHEYGRQMVDFSFNIVNAVNGQFGKPLLNDFTPPFDL